MRPAKKGLELRSSSRRSQRRPILVYERVSQTVLLEVLLGGRDELDGGKLEAVKLLVNYFHLMLRRRNVGSVFLPSVLEAGDDGANQATL